VAMSHLYVMTVHMILAERKRLGVPEVAVNVNPIALPGNVFPSLPLHARSARMRSL